MKYIHFIIVILTILAGCNSTNEASDKVEFESNCKAYDAIDLEMLDLHEAIKNKYKDDALFLKRLQNAQISWIQYRDRHLHSLFPKGYDYYRKNYDNKLISECKCQELTRLTQLRVEDLKVWVEGEKAGWDGCPGSLE